jgi:hypothetical protein
MKRNNLKSFLLTVILVSASSVTHAQNNEVFSEKSSPVNNIEVKFNSLLDKSSSFKEYKVIKKDLLTEFQRSFVSFINNSNDKVSNLNSALEKKETVIQDLNKELSTVKLQNSELNTAVDSISLLGIQLEKGNYNLFMWSLLFTLALVTTFFVYRFKRANEITKYSKGVLADVEDEYQMFKQNSIEREQKLRRQLQDEINKHRKLKEVS